MGVLNVTPDSFSDRGSHLEPEAAVARGLQMAHEGSDLIDVGGESTRPGADPVAVDEELRRVLPAIRSLSAGGIPTSIDTSKPEVAAEAIRAGASVINDVTGFRDPSMREVAARTGAAICIMHMRGDPRTMQENPRYKDVVSEVRSYLSAQADACMAAGIERANIWIDPGIGFGKTVRHNLALLANLPTLANLGYPVLIGASRKSFIGKLTHQDDPGERLGGSIAAALFAASRGARIVRVHDVKETVQALKAWEAIANGPAVWQE